MPAQDLPAPVQARVAPLLTAIAALTAQIAAIDQALAQLVRADAVAQRLCTTPGIGPVTAITYGAVVDQVARFGSAKEVRAYLGLVPREHSSGEHCHRGRITKAGHRRLRALLVEAAWSILRYERAETAALRAWALRIAARRGKRIAAVALARKLAGILYAMWRDGSDFGQPASRRPASRRSRARPAARLVHVLGRDEHPWMSAQLLLGRGREPNRRWRLHPSNPTLRRGPRTASVEREQKDDDHLAPTRTHRRPPKTNITKNA